MTFNILTSGRADYLDFYDLATYCNDAWRGKFTQREISENAYTYKVEYDKSFELGKPTPVMIDLCNQLTEDMDWMDYIEYEAELDTDDMEQIITDFIVNVVTD